MNQVTTLRAQTPERARDFNASQLALIRKTVAKDCNADEFDLFVEVSRRVGLDPFRRQIYALVTSKDNPDKRKMVIITGIDGFRAVAQRNGDYRPGEKPPHYEIDDMSRSDINPAGLVSATVTAFKRDERGDWYPVTGIAYWEEFAAVEEEWAWSEDEQGKRRRKPTGKKTLRDTWKKMPRIMLAKCAESQALRKGWPEDLSGVYGEEEMDRSLAAEASATAVVEAHEEERRLQLVHAKDTVPLLFAITEGITFMPVGQVVDKVGAFLRENDRPEAIEMWQQQNKAGLQQFWALNKTDALEVKRQIEARIADLRRAQPSTILGAS